MFGLIAPLVAPAQAPPDPGRPLTLSLPGLPWALEVATPGFVVTRDEIQPDGRSRYFYAVNDRTLVVLSVREWFAFIGL